MFIKVRNYLAPNFTTEDFRIQVSGPLAIYVYGCHMTPVTQGALGYVCYQRGIIQGHLVHRYASRRTPVLCSRMVFRTVLSLDVSTQTVFLYYMSVNIPLGVISNVFLVSMLPTGCYAKQMKSIQFSILHRLYISLHRWIPGLLLIFVDWYKHSNTNVAGSKCILNR